MLNQVVSTHAGSWTAAARRRAISVGGISLALSGTSFDDVRLGPDLVGFESEPSIADIEVGVEWAASLQATPGKPRFDSGAVWTLFAKGSDELRFDFTSPTLGNKPYKRMYADASFRNARIVLNRELLNHHAHALPLEYPTDELLITNYLANGLGVEVHGCGLVDFETGGHLFLGHSGAGKSTTARLWQSLRRPEILSDDRIILRLQDDGLWMHGTPWHGEARFAAPGKVRVNRIFVLQHGRRNEITPMPRTLA